MKRILCLILFCAVTILNAQEKGKIGGYILPSVGHVNALYIFAQFPDDNHDPANDGWKKGAPIKNMNTWAEDMKSYFAEMSGNKFLLTGKSISVITPRTRQWYLDNGKTRYDIQKEVLEELDKKIDFAEYDNWTLKGNYQHENKPDKIVDFIFFIWRNISHDLKDITVGASKMNFGRFGDLGSGPEIRVDNGTRIIKTNYGGSGITICDYFNENMFRFSIHEFGHYLLGGNNMHTGYGFWGLCSAFGVRSYVINSYERYKLGWGDIITFPYSEKNSTKNIILPDFITTGKALRIPVDKGGTKFFFIENHQVKSRWEKDTTYGHIREGIYVLRQDADFGQSIRIISAEGKYDWEVNQMVQSPWGKEKLPVFKVKKPDRDKGYSSLEYVPYKYKGTPHSPAAIHFSEDPETGAPIEDVKYRGSEGDAFRIGYKEVFSPYSNPNSQLPDRKPSGFGFIIKSFRGGSYTLDIFQNTTTQAPPSKPELITLIDKKEAGIELQWDPNIEPDVITGGKYKVYRATENNGRPGSFMVIKTINAFSEKDSVVSWTDKKNLKSTLYYRITAVDKTGKESLPSDYKFIQKTD